MSRQIITTVYRYSELPDEVRERVRRRAEEARGFPWAEEAMNSIHALAAHFGGKLSNWSIEWAYDDGQTFLTFDMPDMEPDEIGHRLAALGAYDVETLRGLGECKLTGVCYDESAIEGFRRAWHRGERDLSVLMCEAAEAWLADCRDEYEAEYSDEGFSEYCDANKHEFYDDGRPFNG